MPVVDNCNFMFMYNNQTEIGYNSLTSKGEKALFPFTNSIDKDLFVQWKTESFFEIDATNNKIYVDDGALKTATISTGEYTGTELATEIQTQLNTVSSNFTVSYSLTTWFFTIANSGSVDLVLSNQATSAWFTIGFSSIIDLTGTSFPAEEQRNHYPHLRTTVDFGYNAEIGFAALLSPLTENFPLSTSATVTLEGDNLNFATTAEYFETMTVTDQGAFLPLNDQNSSLRYWRLTIEDMYNSNGPEFSFGYFYLGYASQTESRNVSTGLDYSLIDNSSVTKAENGSLYYDAKTKTNKFGSIVIPLATETVRDSIFDLFSNVGTIEPFIISIDPKTQLSTSIKDLTKYVRFTSAPLFKNVRYNIFDISFTLEEVI